MKKLFYSLIFIGVLASASLSFSSFCFQSSVSSEPIEVLYDAKACKFGQCNGIAKSTGVRCLHCVSNQGDLYCYQH
jgi:hypothetical protein